MVHRPIRRISSEDASAGLGDLLDQDWSMIEKYWARQPYRDADDVYADVTAEVEAVRQELYDERTKGMEGCR